jgi:hypothetical protein
LHSFYKIIILKVFYVSDYIKFRFFVKENIFKNIFE